MPKFRYYKHILNKAGLTSEVKEEKPEDDVKPIKQEKEEKEPKNVTCYPWKVDMFPDIPDTEKMVEINEISDLTPLSFKLEDKTKNTIQWDIPEEEAKQKYIQRFVAEVVAFAYDPEDIYTTYQPSDIKHYDACPFDISRTANPINSVENNLLQK